MERAGALSPVAATEAGGWFDFFSSCSLNVLLLAALIAAILIYNLSLAVYRLTLHPLSRFPGPRLAAATYGYEFYYDVFGSGGGGQYRWEIERMHRVYGPIVRITPNEIHVDDPDWYESLYASGGNKIRNKYAPDAHMAGTTMGVFSTVDHHLHRQRKAALAPFFSRRSVHAQEPIIQEKLALLCKALEMQSRTHDTADLHAAFLAFATDVYIAMAIGQPPQPDLLPDLKWQMEFKQTIDGTTNLTPVLKQIPGIITFATGIPSWLIKLLDPKLAKVTAMRERLYGIAEEEIQRARNGEKNGKHSSDPSSIFTAILESKLPVEEKTADRLLEEAFDHLSASGEPSARVLCYGTFYLLSNPPKLIRLREEVEGLCGTNARPSLHHIEALSYLSAVVKESLRISAVVSSRLPLIDPNSTLMYRNWAIPAGTIVSMTPGQMLLDERCFTDPLSFRPERWLGEEDLSIPPEKYFVPFSKGDRICSGISFANAMISVVLAEIVRRYDMSLCDTIRERDVDLARDCFIGKPSVSSQGIRIKLCSR